MMSDAPPAPSMQPCGEIKHFHVTCHARRAAPLQAAAEIAQSAGGPGDREANYRTG